MPTDIRVVLLGKTGAGKSSTGNTLLGRVAFREARGLLSGTERCQWADEVREDGTHLQVTDTPGLCDTHRDEREVLKEVGKSVAVARPGPHIILMVLRCDGKFTKEEFQAYNTLKLLFGDTMKDYMIFVFAGADKFGDTLCEQQAEARKEVEHATGDIAKVLEDANGRFITINNKASPQEKSQQAEELISMMKDVMRANGNRYFSNDLSDQVNELVQPLVTGRMENEHLTRAQADRETTQAIVEEREKPGFFDKLLDIVDRKVLPLIDKALNIVHDAVQVAAVVAPMVRTVASAAQCSVM